MTWAPKETQITFYGLLANDVALQTLLGGTISDTRIYDSVPDNSPYPYVVYNQTDSGDRSNTTKAGWEFTIQLDIYYRGDSVGNLPVHEIEELIDSLFHAQDICVEGWNVISLRRTLERIETEDDNVTKHGILIYNLLLGEA